MPNSAFDSSTTEAWTEQGNQQLAVGDFLEALNSFNEALNLTTHDPKIWYSRGNALLNLGRYEEANASLKIATWTEALTHQPNDYDAWLKRGTGLAELGHYEEAINSYDQALRLKEDFCWAWSGRGASLNNLGQYEQAVKSADRALQIDGKDFHAWYVKGYALKGLAHYEEAIAAFDEALRLKPDYPEALQSREFALRELNSHAEEANSLLIPIGETLFQQGNYKEAINIFQQAIRVDPNNYYPWFRMGMIWGDFLGEYRQAIDCFEQALKINPRSYDTWYLKAHILFHSRYFEESVECCDYALAIKPDYYPAWYKRGKAAGNSVFCRGHYLPQNMHKPELDQRGDEGSLASYNEGLRYVKRETEPRGWAILHQGIGEHYLSKAQLGEVLGGLENQLNSVKYYNLAVKYFTIALEVLDEHLEDYCRTSYFLYKAYLGLRNFKAADEIYEKGFAAFRQLYNQASSTHEWRKLKAHYSGFSSVRVNRFVQNGRLEAALEVAEQTKNSRITWMLEARNCKVLSPSYQDMKELLDDSTAIIYWHIGDDVTTTFILKKDAPLNKLSITGIDYYKFKKLVSDWNREYEDYIYQYKKKQEATERYRHPWRGKLAYRLMELRKILRFEELELQLKDVSNLILIPDCDLHRLPLHALFFCDFAVTYLPSIQTGLTLHHQPSLSLSQATLLSVELSKSEIYSEDDMHFNGIESEIIRRLFRWKDITFLYEEAASKQNVIAALEQAAKHKVFHFTGHAGHNKSLPEESELRLFSDNFLTVKEICHLNLKSCGLVCLSACETAITDWQNIDTDYVGLVSAFLKAGATYVVSTLWPVEPIPSAILMIRFYQFIFAGYSPAIALKQAQNWLRSVNNADLAKWLEPFLALLTDRVLAGRLESRIRNLQSEPDTISYHDRYYWASFVLSGKFSP